MNWYKISQDVRLVSLIYSLLLDVNKAYDSPPDKIYQIIGMIPSLEALNFAVDNAVRKLGQNELTPPQMNAIELLRQALYQQPDVENITQIDPENPNEKGDNISTNKETGQLMA